MNWGDYLKKQAIRHVQEKAARDILNAIDEWRGNSSRTAKRRWVFELVQNAIDCAKARGNEALNIQVDVSETLVTFKHNGGYFIPDEINSVIYGGSSKPYSVESEYLGRFGTGLLVAHVVSKKFDVEGYLGGIEGQVRRFKLHVDRVGSDPATIENGIEDCFSQLNQTEPVDNNPRELWTRYTYYFDGTVPDAIDEGVKELRENLAFVLAFNQIAKLTVNGEEFVAKKIDDYRQCVGEDVVYAWHDQDNELQVAVLVREDKVVSLDGKPKIFVGMPLVETSDYIFTPFVINSTKFKPVRERNALESTYENNKSLIKRSMGLFRDLVEALSKQPNLGKLNNLVALRLIPNQTCAQNSLWLYFNAQTEETFKQVINEISLVRTSSESVPIRRARFPIPTIDSRAMDGDVFQKFCDLASKVELQMPTREQVGDWLETARQLKAIFPDHVSLYTVQDMRNELIGTVENYQKENKNWPHLDHFGKKYNLSDVDARSFLLQWFGVVDSLFAVGMVAENFIEGLLPDQNGILGPTNWTTSNLSFRLFLEDLRDRIPEDLKSITEKIGRNVKGELVHIEFCGFNVVVKYVRDKITTEVVLNNLINNDCYRPPTTVSDWSNAVVQGWVELLRWCLTNGMLKKNFPVISKDAKVQVLNELDVERFFLPFKHLGIPEEFEDLYTKGKILHSTYFDVEPALLDAVIKSVTKYQAFVTRLPVSRSSLSFRHQKLKTIVIPETSHISKVDHEVQASDAKIAALPFWDDLILNIQQKPENSRLLLKFVVEYLIRVDETWRTVTEVACSCKDKHHQIIPSQWLASLKTDKWVAYIDEGADDQKENVATVLASKDSIVKMFGAPDFRGLLAADSGLLIDLLPHLGFDELDLNVSLESIRTARPEKDVRKEVSGLVEVAANVPGLADVANRDIDAFRELIKRHKRALDSVPIKEENRKVGKTVERAIKKLIEQAKFGTKKLKVKTIYKGGDLEMWPVETDGYDCGEVEIASNSMVSKYTMEIKFTTGSRAHLSNAQSETAQVLEKSYVVLVVKDDGALRSQLLGCSEDDQISEEIAYAVNGKSHVIANIHTRLGTVPNPEEMEPDINGYWAKEKLWKDKGKLEDWLTSEFGVE
jgi:hypothetical protein